jgi:hypothetical protein
MTGGQGGGVRFPDPADVSTADRTEPPRGGAPFGRIDFV